MGKKKKNVVRCVSCGMKATLHVANEPVCSNIACHEYVRDTIRAFVNAALDEMKNKK